MKFEIDNRETAPEASRDILKAVEQKYGFIPNLLGVMASAPGLLRAYTTLSALFDESSLSPAERQVVLIAASVENGCQYCVAAHTVIAAMQNVPPEVVHALRTSAPIADAKLESLRRFTQEVVATRGWPPAEAVLAFESAGYSSSQALEVILGIGMKILSNYTNHLAQTPLDAPFSRAAWVKTGASASQSKPAAGV